MRKILVTGANGYIGRHLVKYLCSHYPDCAVIASSFNFDGLDEKALHSPTPIFNGNPDIYNELGCPDVCIHLAWRDGFIHNSAAHMEDLSKHMLFLQNMINGGLPMLTVMGTMHEVGYWEGSIDENTPCNPLSQYGVAKNAMRQSLMLLTHGKKCALHWLRAFYITGDDSRASNIFSKIVRTVQEGKKTFPLNSGKNKYDFIDIDTLSEMIAAASLQDQINGIINVCGGHPVSLAERVESFIKEHNFNIELQYGAFPDRPYDSPLIWGDSKKIKTILKHFHSIVNLEE